MVTPVSREGIPSFNCYSYPSLNRLIFHSIILLLKIFIKIFFIKEEYQIPFIHFEFFFNQKLFTFLILALSEH